VINTGDSMSDCDCKVCAARISDAAAAETEARYANLYGSWSGFTDSKPSRHWVKGEGGWSSFDPVIVRMQERVAARKKREAEVAAKKAARLVKAA
jgi:hypothetical protein